MSVMTEFTLKSLSKNRTRTVVSVVGVALSCALLTAILLSVASIQATLAERTVELEGVWHACAAGIDDEQAERLEEAGWTEDVVVSDVLGSAAFDAESSTKLGDALTIATTPYATKGTQEEDGRHVAIGPKLTEGRMPQAPGEIALPSALEGADLGNGTDGEGTSASSEGPLEIGSAITVQEGGQAPSWTDGAGEFTVVGFYSPTSSMPGYCTVASNDGQVGLVVSGAYRSQEHQAWMTATDVGSTEELERLVTEEVGDQADVVVHGSLLRAMGRSNGYSTWTSIANFGLILAGIVVLASISLIYNAFAISVSERTRQFGLLSSIGATRKQLRRSVLFEALVVGLASIPAGLVVGTLGTAVVLEATAEAFSSALGMQEGLRIVLSPAAYAIAAALTAVVLLASAWVPSRRASRTTAIDAIRQSSEVRMSRRTKRKMAASKAVTMAVGMGGRLFGAPGAIAKRNLSRSASRGRSVVAALAVSVLLVVASGSVALYLEPLYNLANARALGGEVDVQATLSATEAAPDGNVVLDGAKLDRFMADAESAEGVESSSVVAMGRIDASLPAGILTAEGTDAARRFEESAYSASELPSSVASDGSYAGSCAIVFVEEDEWRALASEVGADAEHVGENGAPNAIAANSFTRYDAQNERYVTVRPFATAGEATVYDFDKVEGMTNPALRASEDGSLRGYSFDLASTAEDPSAAESWPVEEISTTSTVNVVALADEQDIPPAAADALQAFPVLIMPIDESLPVFSSAYYATASFKAADHAKAAEALDRIAREHSDGSVSITVADLAQTASEYLMIVQAIELFINCFAAITMLVAVANVFNTIANSVSLRRREFAILKSMGMDDRAFAKMLCLECASYAVKGLAAGMALAFLATYGLYNAIGLSFTGIAFRLPVPSMAIATCLVVVVLAASVVFALKKTSSDNVAESLRSDAA